MDNIKEIRNDFEQNLIDNGFKFYVDTWGKSLRIIQKSYTCDIGIKYFITARHYNFAEQLLNTITTDLDSAKDRYTFSSQFITSKDQTINVDFSADFLPNEYRDITTLAEVELFFENIWNHINPEYNEKF